MEFAFFKGRVLSSLNWHWTDNRYFAWHISTIPVLMWQCLHSHPVFTTNFIPWGHCNKETAKPLPSLTSSLVIMKHSSGSRIFGAALSRYLGNITQRLKKDLNCGQTKNLNYGIRPVYSKFTPEMMNMSTCIFGFKEGEQNFSSESLANIFKNSKKKKKDVIENSCLYQCF